jgi:mannose-6-phosphate isomerase
MVYPYKFTPALIERVWGGNALRRYGKPVPDGKRIGESWEISDRDDVQSVVANGPDAGKTLRQLIEWHGAKLLGTNCGSAHPRSQNGRDARSTRFPLLIKLLDARERLSLQVHPPGAVARQLGGDPKTEMWYVLEADPGAQLIAGLKHSTTREQFEDALRSDSPMLCDLIHRFPVRPGDCFFVPSGRLHAIDAGVVLVEIQQNSDTTYRVYDWGRVGLDGKPRQLHLKESLACINFDDFEPEKQKPTIERNGANRLGCLVEWEYFHVHWLELHDVWPDQCDGSTFHVITCVEGALSLLALNGEMEMRINPGEFVLLPAAIGHYTVKPLAATTCALKAYVPAAR